MWTRRGLLALVLGVFLTGCGQHQSPRAAVAAYLKKVNKIETALATPLTSVTKAGAQFAQELHSGGSLTSLVFASNEQALRKAWSQIELQRGRLAALHTPSPAAHLQSLLLQIADGQASLTREVAQLVSFLPRYNQALKPLGRATRRLEVALSQQTALGPSGVAAVYASKAAALRQFQASVDSVLVRIERLRPPAVSKPDYNGQVSALRGMSSASGRLATSLQGGPTGNVQQLLTQFDRAATSNQSLAVQKSRIAAIKAYDAESARLAALSLDAERERLRLANNLA